MFAAWMLGDDVRAGPASRGDGDVSSNLPVRPEGSGGLGKPGAESRSSSGIACGMPPPVSRRPRVSSAAAELPSAAAVCATSSSSWRTLVASSNASAPNSSASEWNGIGLGSGVSCESARARPLWLPSNASCTGAGATRVGVSVNIGGLVGWSFAPRCGACFAFSARIFSSTFWLPSPRRSKRTPMPGAIAGRLGSFSRVHTTVPSPAISGDASRSWNSNFICVPTASGSLVRIKMPPWLTSTA